MRRHREPAVRPSVARSHAPFFHEEADTVPSHLLGLGPMDQRGDSPSFEGNSGHVALGTWALLPRALFPRPKRTFGVSQGLFVGLYLLPGLKDIKDRLVWPMKAAQ